MDQEVLEALKRAVEQQRPWGNYFWWHQRSPAGKAIQEYGATEELIRSLVLAGRRSYREPRPSGSVWPDCEAMNDEGEIVAIEVTELLGGNPMAAAPSPWSTQMLLERVQERLRTKDLKSFHGGKYQEVVLLIHTDEPLLTQTAAFAALQPTALVVPHGNITRAFLLMGYSPLLGCCPVLELQLRHQPEA